MTKDEALKLALEALEDIGDEWGFTSQRTVPKRKEAITAIKESLVQPEPEYLAFMDTPQSKPLSDEEIQDLLMPVRISGDGYYLRIARAIEAAHGIKGEA